MGSWVGAGCRARRPRTMAGRLTGANLRSGAELGLVVCGLGATVRNLSFSPLDAVKGRAHRLDAGGAMSKFAPSIRRWGSDEFALRLSELRALGISLFLMAGIAMLAFVACAVLQ